MASVKSLGLHEPSALPFLITESILPPDPPKSLYKWQTDVAWDAKKKKCVEEELLITNTCVVWSACGVIQRVYNLSIEGESILQAFTASFNSVTSFSARDAPENSAHSHDNSKSADPCERGLVVVLRSHVHIFLASGDSHVVPLSFETESAFAGPRGFFLQRKVAGAEAEPSARGPDSTDLLHQPSSTPANNQSKPSLVLPYQHHGFWRNKPQSRGFVPRMFYFTDILSELGVVGIAGSATSEPGRESEKNDLCLGEDETLINVSFYGDGRAGPTTSEALTVAVTCNRRQQLFTFWQVVYHDDPDARTNTQPPEKSKNISRRKSSKMYGRQSGTATPISHAVNPRESFAALAHSFVETIPEQETFVQKLPSVEDLETQLAAEFEPSGVQTRSARRVSSMLARTDLAMGYDRNILNDFTMGRSTRKNVSKSVRRGESIGSFSDRQSFGPQRRSSFAGRASIMSDATSFLATAAAPLMEEVESMLNLDLDEQVNQNYSELPKDVRFHKIKSIPWSGKNTEVSLADENFKVFSLVSPDHSAGNPPRFVSLCIMSQALQELAVVNFSVRSDSTSKRSLPKHKVQVRVKMKEVRRGTGIVDACKVQQESTCRILLLTKDRNGHSSLQLEAPWSAPARIDTPPEYVVFDRLAASPTGSLGRRLDMGLNRTISGVGQNIRAVRGVGIQGDLAVEDAAGKLHRLHLQLLPRDEQVLHVLRICNFVLPKMSNDGLQVGWWETVKWLKTKDDGNYSEWTALMVLLFALAVPFLEVKQLQKASASIRKKDTHHRTSSGTTVDLASFNAMLEHESLHVGMNGRRSNAWSWMNAIREPSKQPLRAPSPNQPRKSSSASSHTAEKSMSRLLEYVSLTRDFLQSPVGETAIGPEGYLPTAVNQDRELRRTSLAAIVVGLHLAREESKLNNLDAVASTKDMEIAAVLAQFGHWLGWDAWTWHTGSYYAAEIGGADEWVFEMSRLTTLETPAQPFEPPSIFDTVERCVLGEELTPFPTLLDVAARPRSDAPDGLTRRAAFGLTPRSFAILSFISSMPNIKNDAAVLKSMLECGIDSRMLESIPEGIAAVFHKAVASRRSCPRSLSEPLLNLLGREDVGRKPAHGVQNLTNPKTHRHPSHKASRDYHSIVSLALETDVVHAWDASSGADRHTVTRLIFAHDRRFQEASKLVNQTRPPLVLSPHEPEWTEAELLDAQKELVQHVTRRTLSVASGRGMMHYVARVPLLTERVPIPAFSLQCVMKPPGGPDSGNQAITFSADKAVFTEDKVCWAFFHNGASAGLMISREAPGIDTSWILYNKPPEPTNRHAGFLLALGLNGHLKTLAKWVAFKYLTPKHTMTSIGLLLGLSASYIGTMDTLITRLLSVHVTRLLPPGAAELNLSGLTQTAGILGAGLVYLGSGHRRMSEVMVSEVENMEIDEPGGGAVPSNPGGALAGEETVLRDEGYRLAAGFALGLINLGKGKKLDGLRDLNILDRLLGIAVSTKNVDFVNVLDRATAGAVVAVALMWMKTNDEHVASQIDIPDTTQQFEYVRPDVFLLRTLAKHLILWDRITASDNFVASSLPTVYRKRATLQSTKMLRSEDLPFFYTLTGILWSIGLRFGGSLSEKVRDLLVAYLDQFVRLARLPALNYDTKLTRNAVRNCQDTVALAAASVMAGSGDLVVLRRLRSLHGRTDPDTPYGSHLAAHMAIGALFLGGGTCTFGTSLRAVAGLVISFYPVWPTDVLDNKSHLQALRHLWTLAVEERCIVAREVGSNRAVSLDLQLTLKDGESKNISTPAIVPDLDSIQSLEVKSGEYWEVHLDFSHQETLERIKRDQSVWLQRRAAYDRPASEVFVAELQALEEASTVPSAGNTSHAHQSVKTKNSTFQWLFDLEPFRDLDQAERALLLPPQGYSGVNGADLLRGTVVDTRMDLEYGVLGADKNDQAMERDRLWQLRLLFAWVDRWDSEEEEEEEEKKEVMRRGEGAGGKRQTGVEAGVEYTGTWLRREVIDRLRWRVWKMASAGGDHTDQEDGDNDVKGTS